MFFYILALFVGLAAALSKEASKVLKSPPYITNSLVNLGKMDISFYFNTKDKELLPGIGPVTNALNKMDLSTVPQNLMYSKPITPVEEPCPCSMLRNYKDSNPAAVLNKILSGNDMFTYKNPTSSIQCCESHEEITSNNDQVFLDLGPKAAVPSADPTMSLPPLPFIFENFFNRDMSFAPPKPKTIEILFFPKKTPQKNQLKTKFTPIVTIPNPVKKDISVRDKSLEKEFKNYDEKIYAASVKKDLKEPIVLESTTLENKETDENLLKDNNNL